MSRSRRAKSAVRLPFPSAKVNPRAAYCSAAVFRSRLLCSLCCRLRMASGRRSAFSNQLRFSLAEQAAQAARWYVTASARSSNLSGSGCAAKAVKNFSMPSSPRKAGSKKLFLFFNKFCSAVFPPLRANRSSEIEICGKRSQKPIEQRENILN